MKIAAVRAIPLAIPPGEEIRHSVGWERYGRQVIVQVETDDGAVGLGEAFALGGQVPVCRVIEDTLAPLLVGEDPTRIEYLADRLQRSTHSYTRRGIGMYAISGVEIALWDLLGKLRGVPLYELLGGLSRPRLPAYASLPRYATPADVAAAAEAWVDKGFRWIKLHQIDPDSARSARYAMGPEAGLLVDTNCPWTPGEALAMAKLMAPCGLTWLEEPIWPPEDYDALAELRRISPVPIALGENESTAIGFREVIAKRAADVLQPSVTKVGGIGELRRVAALASAANVPVVPHSFYFGPGLAATLHLAASFASSTMASLPAVEFPGFSQEMPMLSEPISAAADGTLAPPPGPGLGVSLNEEALKQYAL